MASVESSNGPTSPLQPTPTLQTIEDGVAFPAHLTSKRISDSRSPGYRRISQPGERAALASFDGSMDGGAASALVGGRRISVHMAAPSTATAAGAVTEDDATSVGTAGSKGPPAGAIVIEEETSAFLLKPNGPFLKWWDTLMLVTLIFTGLVTPFEVSFLPLHDTHELSHPMFAINTILEILFGADMLFHFVTPYFDTGSNEYIDDHRKIALHYVKSLFALDIITLLPWDFIVQNADGGSLRLVRFLRFVKLAKILRALRANKLVDRMKIRWGMSTSALSLMTFVLLLVLEGHWMACVWHLTAILQPEGVSTWIDTLTLYESNVFDRYTASLEWACQTISLVGGSAVGAINPAERLVAAGCQIMAACTYAMIIGYTAGILTKVDLPSQDMAAERDDLNRYMAEIHLPLAVRMRAREHFDHCSKMYVTGVRATRTLQHLPMDLRKAIAQHSHGPWIANINWIKSPEEAEYGEFVAALTRILEPTAFGPLESITREGGLATHMYIITKGLAVSGAAVKLMGTHQHFGEEILLTNGRYFTQTRSVTFLFTHTLSKVALTALLNSGLFDSIRLSARKATIRMALRREFLQAVRLSKLHRGFLMKMLGRVDPPEPSPSPVGSVVSTTTSQAGRIVTVTTGVNDTGVLNTVRSRATNVLRWIAHTARSFTTERGVRRGSSRALLGPATGSMSVDNAARSVSSPGGTSSTGKGVQLGPTGGGGTGTTPRRSSFRSVSSRLMVMDGESGAGGRTTNTNVNANANANRNLSPNGNYGRPGDEGSAQSPPTSLSPGGYTHTNGAGATSIRTTSRGAARALQQGGTTSSMRRMVPPGNTHPSNAAASQSLTEDQQRRRPALSTSSRRLIGNPSFSTVPNSARSAKSVNSATNLMSMAHQHSHSHSQHDLLAEANTSPVGETEGSGGGSGGEAVWTVTGGALSGDSHSTPPADDPDAMASPREMTSLLPGQPLHSNHTSTAARKDTRAGIALRAGGCAASGGIGGVGLAPRAVGASRRYIPAFGPLGGLEAVDEVDEASLLSPLATSKPGARGTQRARRHSAFGGQSERTARSGRQEYDANGSSVIASGRRGSTGGGFQFPDSPRISFTPTHHVIGISAPSGEAAPPSPHSSTDGARSRNGATSNAGAVTGGGVVPDGTTGRRPSMQPLALPKAPSVDEGAVQELETMVGHMPLLARVFSRAKLSESFDPSTAAVLSALPPVSARAAAVTARSYRSRHQHGGGGSGGDEGDDTQVDAIVGALSSRLTSRLSDRADAAGGHVFGSRRELSHSHNDASTKQPSQSSALERFEMGNGAPSSTGGCGVGCGSDPSTPHATGSIPQTPQRVRDGAGGAHILAAIRDLEYKLASLQAMLARSLTHSQPLVPVSTSTAIVNRHMAGDGVGVSVSTSTATVKHRQDGDGIAVSVVSNPLAEPSAVVSLPLDGTPTSVTISARGAGGKSSSNPDAWGNTGSIARSRAHAAANQADGEARETVSSGCWRQMSPGVVLALGFAVSLQVATLGVVVQLLVASR